MSMVNAVWQLVAAHSAEVAPACSLFALALPLGLGEQEVRLLPQPWPLPMTRHALLTSSLTRRTRRV